MTVSYHYHCHYIQYVPLPLHTLSCQYHSHGIWHHIILIPWLYHTITIVITYCIMPSLLSLHAVSCHYPCHFIQYHTIEITITNHTMSLPLPFHTVSYHYYCHSMHHIITITITIIITYQCNPFLEWHLLPGRFAFMTQKKHDHKKPIISTTTSDMKYSSMLLCG